MLNQNNKFKLKYLSLLFLLVIISLFSTSRASAASLSLAPSQMTVSVGNIVSLKVVTSTDNKIINNAEANIQFPTDMLEVVSISKSSSIFTLWVEEPTFSNSTGKISFSGGLPNPGYTGQNGQIATITFKAKKTGSASVFFTDGAVRENDGLGTDILISKNNAIIKIGVPEVVEVPQVPSDQRAVLLKPLIISETHPDQDIWSMNNVASFSWKIPSDVTSIKTLLSKSANTTPTITYDSSVSQKTFNNVSDGISYFYLRFYNSAGGSQISKYTIKIDKTPPKSFSPTIRLKGNKSLVKLNAVDLISGMNYYTIKIDNNALITVKINELIDDEFILPVLNEGSHELNIVAYDKAGNKTEASVNLSSPAITVPILSISSNEIIAGEIVTITGKTDYPNQKINIILEKDGKEIKRYTETTDSTGNFSLATDKIKTTGLISIWAETVFSDLIKSNPSEKIQLKVNVTKLIGITFYILYRLIILVIILIFLLGILILLYLGWHKYLGLKRKIEEETKEIAVGVHKDMVLLKEKLNEELKELEEIKKEGALNEKEENIFRDIQNRIDKIEEFIDKNLKKLL